MYHLTADQELLERLAGIMEPVEIRDANGKLIGQFTPMFADENDKSERAARYFDLADAERSLTQEREPEYTLAEVWARIRSGEIQG